MRKIKIIETHPCRKYNIYNQLIEMLEIKSTSDWTEVTEEEFKAISKLISQKSNYILIELHNKDSAKINIEKLIENLKKEEAGRKEAERIRAEKAAALKRKQELEKEAKKKIAFAKKLEKARKLLADAGQL